VILFLVSFIDHTLKYILYCLYTDACTQTSIIKSLLESFLRALLLDRSSVKEKKLSDQYYPFRALHSITEMHCS